MINYFELVFCGLQIKKILEIYSDIPKPLLSNYKFFDGLKGGQLLLSSSYDSQKSDTNLIIENFKVVDAPDLVKLLSLAETSSNNMK